MNGSKGTFIWGLIIGIVIADSGIVDAAGNEIDALDILAFTESAREVDHILCLTAGIRVPAKLEIVTTNQTMDADEQEISAPVS